MSISRKSLMGQCGVHMSLSSLGQKVGHVTDGDPMRVLCADRNGLT